MSKGVVIKINDKTMKELERLADKEVYEIARVFLDKVETSKITPYKTGTMQRTMSSSGVKGSNNNYYIGNFTNYAGYVYARPQNTNWTNPLSEAQWFETYWKRNGKTIFENVVARYRI